MDVVNIFKKALDTFKANYVIAVPNLVVNLIVLALMISVVGGAMVSVGSMMAFGKAPSIGAFGPAFGLFGLLMILVGVLGIAAWGAAVGMAKEAIDTGKTTLDTGISVVKNRLADLVIAAIIVGILVAVGLMLLVIPGLIIGFFLMLTLPALIIDNLGAIDALKKSFDVVKNKIGDAVVLVVGILLAAIVVGIAVMILGIIPLLGQVLGIVLDAAFAGYLAIVLALFYAEAKQ